jgi:hypothetical protein
MSRIASPTEKDYTQLEKYRRAPEVIYELEPEAEGGRGKAMRSSFGNDVGAEQSPV